MKWTKSGSSKIWDKESSARAKKLEDDFKGNLRNISDCLADHEELRRVEVKHVNQAFDALTRSGLQRRRWIDRPETLMSAGTFLIGIAWACPDAIALFFSTEISKSVAIGALVALFCSGLMIFFLGLYLARLPSVASEQRGWKTAAKQIAVTLLLLFILAAIAYMFWARFIYVCPTCGDGPEPEMAPLSAEAIEVSERPRPSSSYSLGTS